MRGKNFFVGTTAALALFTGASCTAGRSDAIDACDPSSDSGVAVEPTTVASIMTDVNNYHYRREVRIDDPNGWTKDIVDSAGEIACRGKDGELHFTMGGLAVNTAIAQIKAEQLENN